ncbi:lactate utilization protein B/C [Streptomyces abyssalis]|uniref:Lactate utilization protein B/C n=1 Tax=Streptomyces abyssalis TaxID=933944 RepID=A0A1E7JT48_9ACTN|nr:lactate utilization protein C [Streptomyces abyssalis]OEU92073.1 lactate utilization protein B/C [Streptomyces abyssalis]OEU94647.1 lactate utilization protein B/C [Streptomyces abyssalis]OEV27776.1 lactate utilization protein B/C [Streptomyces nanshensis]
MNSRETVLGRVRRALADVPRDEGPDETHVPRDYWTSHAERSDAERLDLLAENLADYRALVHRCGAGELPATIAELLRARGARSVVAPPGIPEEWLPAEVERVADDPAASPRELDALDSVVTGCAVAVAETGTIVLDAGEDQGRRRISLVPDHHICVVRAPEQIVDSVPQALRRLDPARPQTWISGPSATSDIELDRVEGVHGPRTLEVIITSPEP